MTASKLLDFKKLLSEYLAETTALLNKHGFEHTAVSLKSEIEPRLKEYVPSLMFYGIYNAGKSTLLNAIFGEERASVADVPETKSVTRYAWGGYDLVDTPGINGPEEDYRLSRNELEKHDVILFVIDDSETFDNRIVTQEILKIIQMNKPLIIVLNNKQIADSDEGDEMRAQQIRKKIFANLQREAENYGIEKIQSKYTFLRVNAESALRGKLQNKHILMQSSGIEDLEITILEKLREVDGPKILRPPIYMILKNLTDLLENLKQSIKKEDEKNLLHLLTTLSTQKNTLYQTVYLRVRQQIYSIGDEIYRFAANGQDIQFLVEQLQRIIETIVNEEIQQAMYTWKKSIKTQVNIPALNIPRSIPNLNELTTVAINIPEVSQVEKVIEVDSYDSISGNIFRSLVRPIIKETILIEIVRMILNYHKQREQEQKEFEKLKAQVAEANAKQQELLHAQIAMLQNLNTKIRLSLFKFEEETIRNVRETIDNLFTEIEKEIREQINDVERDNVEIETSINAVTQLMHKLQVLDLQLDSI
ncbi:50S ribosome-binding GTPase [Anoxybacillus flavithermus]